MNSDKSNKNILPPLLDESDLVSLFYKLAVWGHKPQAHRVARIMDLLLVLENEPKGPRRLRARGELGSALDRYKWRSRVSPSAQGIHASYAAEKADHSVEDRWEYGAVADLMLITNHPGALARLRRCESCGAWLFAARRRDQRFCSGKCKQAAHYSNPEKRERHLENMRKQYAQLRGLAKNPKSGVGLKSAVRLPATKDATPKRMRVR